MDLTPRQLSSLKDMGIPVWEVRSTEPEQTIPVAEQRVSAEPSEQLLNCDWVVLIDAQTYTKQAGQLLHAMLYAIGIEQNQVAIIDSEQLSQLQKVSSQSKILFVLGEHLAQPLQKDTLSRGSVYHVLNSQITTVISFSLDELLANPANKALAWQDLKLAKQTLFQ